MTNDTLSSEEFIQQTEAFAAALQKGDLAEAQAIDNQLIGLVGSEGRVDLFKAGVPIRPLLGYSFNRAILRLHQGRIEEAAFCMNDTTRSLFYSRMHQDIYFLLDCLAESRGQHDIFSSPFETACDYLMMGIITQPYFQAMSLSFLWKSKTIYTRLGHADIGGFVEELIGLQCSMVEQDTKRKIQMAPCCLKESPKARMRLNCTSLNRTRVGNWSGKRHRMTGIGI